MGFQVSLVAQIGGGLRSGGLGHARRGDMAGLCVVDPPTGPADIDLAADNTILRSWITRGVVHQLQLRSLAAAHQFARDLALRALRVCFGLNDPIVAAFNGALISLPADYPRYF